MPEALEEEAADGDEVGAEEGDEVEGDDDVEGDGAAELDQAEDEGEEGGGEDGVEGDVLVVVDLGTEIGSITPRAEKKVREGKSLLWRSSDGLAARRPVRTPTLPWK